MSEGPLVLVPGLSRSLAEDELSGTHSDLLALEWGVGGIEYGCIENVGYGCMETWVWVYGNLGMGVWKHGVWVYGNMGYECMETWGMGVGLTEVSSPYPSHGSLTSGSWFVEVTRSTCWFVYHCMRLGRKRRGRGE